MAERASLEITQLDNVDIKYLVPKAISLLSDRGAAVSCCFTTGGLKGDPLLVPTRGSVSFRDRDILATAGGRESSSSTYPPALGKNSG